MSPNEQFRWEQQSALLTRARVMVVLTIRLLPAGGWNEPAAHLDQVILSRMEAPHVFKLFGTRQEFPRGRGDIQVPPVSSSWH
jgi:hypothetical protein